MELTYLIHHAMDAEITKLATNLLLEHIDEHDVNHSLDQRVRTLTTYMRQLICPTSVVVVLNDAELQLEQVGEGKQLTLWIV